jgi:hypothetical protein
MLHAVLLMLDIIVNSVGNVFCCSSRRKMLQCSYFFYRGFSDLMKIDFRGCCIQMVLILGMLVNVARPCCK